MYIPEPRKLANGEYFIQLRLNGVSIPVSASTKSECKAKAALIKSEYKNGKRKIAKTELTLGQILDNYIAKYENALSPSTIRGYSNIRRNRFVGYMDKPFSRFGDDDWQEMISSELKIKSEKTVKNGWGALTAAISDMKLPVPDVKLAVVPVHEMAYLDPEEIPLFIEAAKGDMCELEMLLELHSLRESEAMAVINNGSIDLKHNTISVRGALVPNKENKFVSKDTNKSRASTRIVPIMIPRLRELWEETLAGDKKRNAYSASAILDHVHATCARAGITDVTNHGLRHTFASLGYSLGWSERMLMEIGGWDDPGTMHKVYIRLAARDREKAKNSMADFYSTPSEASLNDVLSDLKMKCGEYKDQEKLKPIIAAIEALEKEQRKNVNANKNANIISTSA